MPKQRRTVHPVPDRWLNGIPAVPIIVDAPLASRLVATGAFRRDAPEGHPEPIDLTDEQAALLDQYDTGEPEPDGSEPEPEKAKDPKKPA